MSGYVNVVSLNICCICQVVKCNVITQCGHQFCLQCLSKWIRCSQDKNSCPICIQNIGQLRYINILCHIKKDTCHVCDKYLPLNLRFKCGACRRIYYCNIECQKLDWLCHKKVCKYIHL